ncbi:nitroreductase, partial [Clostridioides difficile]|nr:nitroreductase [Clostridioides difficile]
NPDIIREEFSLPDNLEPINILLMGYEAGTPESPDRHNKTRLPLNEIVSYETL